MEDNQRIREPPQFDMENARHCQVTLERCDNVAQYHETDPLDISQVSQGSSCDYSMSQFKKDEPNFVIKEEASDSEDGTRKVQVLNHCLVIVNFNNIEYFYL